MLFVLVSMFGVVMFLGIIMLLYINSGKCLLMGWLFIMFYVLIVVLVGLFLCWIMILLFLFYLGDCFCGLF